MNKIITFINDKNFINIIWSFSAKIIAMVFFFLVDIVIARFLDITGYATWTYYYSLRTMFGYIGCFGMNSAAKIMISKGKDLNEQGLLYRLCFKYRMITASVFSILLTCFLPFFKNILDEGNQYPDLQFLLYFIGIVVFFNIILEFFKQIGYGLPDFKLVFNANIFDYGVYFIIVFLSVLIMPSLKGVLLGCIVAGALGTLASIKYVKKKYAFPKLSSEGLDERKGRKQIVKYSIPLMTRDITNFVVMELDTVMLGMLTNAGQLAFYNIGKKLTSKVSHINIAISSGVMTTFSSINSDNFKEKYKLYLKYFLLNFVFSIGVVLVLLMFGFFGIELIYGSNFSPAKNIILLLVPYYLMFSLRVYMSLFLDFRNKLNLQSFINVICVCLNVLLNFMFIPRYGAIGAVASTLLTEIPNFLCVLFQNINIWKQYKKQYYN